MHKFLANYIHFTKNYKTMSLLLWLCCCLLVGLHSAAAEFQTFHHQLGSESLSLLVVGDWGRRGAYNQSQVAHQVVLLFYFFLFTFFTYILTYLQIFKCMCTYKFNFDTSFKVKSQNQIFCKIQHNEEVKKLRLL